MVDVEQVVNSVPRDVLVVVDHTFATPLTHRPLEWGADLAVYSTSKYIAGHNDTLGGVVSFEVRGDLEETSRFIDATRPFFHIGPSFGGSESLIEQPALVSFYEKTPEERLALGISGNLVRFSVGVMPTRQVVAVLDHALSES